MQSKFIHKDGFVYEYLDHKDIIYMWKNKRKNSIIYHNIQTGEQSTNLKDVIRNKPHLRIDLANVNSYICVAMAEAIEMDSKTWVHVEWGKLHTTRCKQGEVREIENRNSILFNKQKEIFAVNALNLKKSKDGSIILSNAKENGIRIPKPQFENYDFIKWLTDDYYTTVTKRVIGNSGMVGGNQIIYFQYPWDINYWLSYREPKKRSSPSQKLIDVLTSCTLPEPPSVTVTDNKPIQRARVDKVVVDGVAWGVLRTFIDNVEGVRIYVSKNKTIAAKPTANGFVPFPSWKQNPINWHFSLLPYTKEEVENTPLEYYVELIKNVQYEHAGFALWLFLAHPIFEEIIKLSKNGEQLVNQFVTDWIFNSEPMYNLERFWGKIDTKKKKLHRKFGLSAKVFNEALESYQMFISNEGEWRRDRSLVFPKLMKYLLHQDDISGVDQKTWGNVIDFLQNSKTDYRSKYIDVGCYAIRCFDAMYSTYNLKTGLDSVDLLDNINKMTEERTRLFCTNWSVLFIDTCRMISTLNLSRDIKLHKITDVNEIRTIHDDLTSLINTMEIENADEKWDYILKKCKKWTYVGHEEDNYIIIAPETPKSLITEGATLHHCVRNYIDRVAKGETNILFIRSKSDPETPFFTVEISNDSTVEQIHGLLNRNLDSEPDLIPFVKKWIKAKNLKYTNYNKVR